ncbi:MAG: glycoside hydrolase family 43 protein [Burkholderiales bacterium]|nr:glycoside hydrolase family 43 protein [Phycisphaerae bacterium]
MYLFTYFKNNGEDGLHLAYSADGLKYTTLKNDKSFLTPVVGESKLMRDPCVVRGPDGTFHMVWTTAWQGKTIGYASSRDLITWTPQRALPVMEHEKDCKNCWAPEIAIDEKGGHFVIFWATTIPGRFKETESGGDNNHRMYCTTTTDFKTFTPTELFYDPGFNVIDATFYKNGKDLYLIVKDETKNPVRKDLRIAKAESVTGPFGKLSEPFTPAWVEGPTAVRIGEDCVVFYDAYTKHHYGAIKTRDFQKWEDITPQISIPRGARHGTIIEVSDDVIKPLLAVQ